MKSGMVERSLIGLCFDVCIVATPLYLLECYNNNDRVKMLQNV